MFFEFEFGWWGLEAQLTNSLSCHKMMAPFARTFQRHAIAPDASVLNFT